MDVVDLLFYSGVAPQLDRLVVLLPELPVREKRLLKRPRGVSQTRERLCQRPEHQAHTETAKGIGADTRGSCARRAVGAVIEV